MEQSSTLSETLSEDWFRQINGLLDGIQVQEQIVQNVSDQPAGIYDRYIFKETMYL